MTDIADILDRAADLIDEPGRWMQGDYWRDPRGRTGLIGRPPADAICFCLVGAVAQAGEFSPAAAERELGSLVGIFDGRSPSVWNDAPERTQAEVVAKLREAAAKARGEPA